MKLTSSFIPLCVFILTLQRVCSLCEFRNYSSPIANYSKLRDFFGPQRNYASWAQMCQSELFQFAPTNISS